jgi:hypothetical protein
MARLFVKAKSAEAENPCNVVEETRKTKPNDTSEDGEA